MHGEALVPRTWAAGVADAMSEVPAPLSGGTH